MDAAIWISVGSVIVAAVSAVFTGLQVREARKAREATIEAVKAQSDDAKRAAEASERSAKAAEDSARTAAEALEISQRAWLTVEHLEVKHYDSATGMPL